MRPDHHLLAVRLGGDRRDALGGKVGIDFDRGGGGSAGQRHRGTQIGVCIDRRVRRILRAGAFDVAADFAAHLLFDVMCEMIRIPESERGELRPVSTMSWALETTLPIARRDRAAAEIHRSRAYLVEHVSRPAVRAASPFVAAAYAALSGEDGQDVGRAVATLVEVMLVMGNDALGACDTFTVERLKAKAVRRDALKK